MCRASIVIGHTGCGCPSGPTSVSILTGIGYLSGPVSRHWTTGSRNTGVQPYSRNTSVLLVRTDLGGHGGGVVRETLRAGTEDRRRTHTKWVGPDQKGRWRWKGNEEKGGPSLGDSEGVVNRYIRGFSHGILPSEVGVS